MRRFPSFLRPALFAVALQVLAPASASSQPVISVAPDTLRFDDLIVSQSQTKQVAITNTGTSLLTINSIMENSQDFYIGGYAPVLNPGQTFLLDVTFEPQAVSSPRVSLAIGSDAINGPNTFVFLEGTALPPAPLISTSETAIDFGTIVVGSATQRTLKINNTGTAQLLISRVLSSDPVFLFGLVQSTVPAGGSIDVTVVFNPDAADDFSATMTIESNALNDPILGVALSGSAVSYDVIIVPTAVEAALPRMGSLQTVVQIANTGSVPFPFTNFLFGLSSPAASVGTQSPPAALPAFFDNFEDGNALGWTFAPGGSPARGVLPGPGANGSAFIYQEGMSVAGHHNGLYTTLPAVRPTQMGFWVRPGQTNLYSGYVTVRDVALREAIYFFAQSNGTFYCNASTGGDASQPYIASQWYHVEYRNIDWSAKTFDYHLDGALVTAGVSMRNPGDVEDFSRVDLYSFSAGATTQWDDVFVLWGAAPLWLSVAPASGTIAVAGVGEITLDMDATGLSHGTHEAVLAMRSNDPSSPLIPVPVTLTVDSTVTAAAPAPAPVALFQNTPNPFEGGTSIRYVLDRPSRAALRVYDVRGALVRTLEDRAQTAGSHEAFWDGRDNQGRTVASGVYFYRLTAGGDFAQTRKLLMLR